MGITPFRSAAAALLAAAVTLPAQADTEQARKLLAEGRAGQALRVLDEQLAGSPQDAEARFLRGLALSRTGRREEAIENFKKLSSDYPQLPEPYNNLAVIYAQQGDYEKARKALESALATHPSYATAHENLGDIYAALASASYGRALSLDDGDRGSARQKLRVLEQLSGTGAVTASVAPSSTDGQPTQERAAETTTTAAETDATMAPPAQAPAAPTSGSERATRERISAAVYDWAQAWQDQNLDAYLAAYAPDFQPAGGLSREAWEAQRRDRVGSPDSIRVRVRNPDIEIVNDERARVTFEQEYESDSYSDVTNKVLDLRRAGNRWLILRETTR